MVNAIAKHGAITARLEQNPQGNYWIQLQKPILAKALEAAPALVTIHEVIFDSDAVTSWRSDLKEWLDTLEIASQIEEVSAGALLKLLIARKALSVIFKI